MVLHFGFTQLLHSTASIKLRKRPDNFHLLTGWILRLCLPNDPGQSVIRVAIIRVASIPAVVILLRISVLRDDSIVAITPNEQLVLAVKFDIRSLPRFCRQ